MTYFIRSPDGLIKIGTTIQLSQRLKQLAVEHGPGLEVLAVVDGDLEVEQGLHRRFAHLNVVNEWFEPGDDLVGFIVTEAKPWNGKDDIRPPISAKLPPDVVESARIVAAFRNESMSDLIGNILRPILKKMEREEMAKRSRNDKQE